MSESRVFLDAALAAGQTLELPESAFRHLVQVLRMQAGEALTVFNGEGGEYAAKIATVSKRSASLQIGAYCEVDRESPLQVTLVQGISKGDRMDFTLQKAVELGVSAVQPVITERCNVHLDRERQDKKVEHWRGVIIAACEQSGRTRVPDLLPTLRFTDWLGQPARDTRVVLDPLAARSLASVDGVSGALSVVVGPEGGLSAGELAMATRAACIGVRLGPRVLRTETAGVAALAVLQSLAGDWRDA